jgi:hypothetical protein
MWMCNICGAKRQLAEAFGRENREKMPLCKGRSASRISMITIRIVVTSNVRAYLAGRQ